MASGIHPKLVEAVTLGGVAIRALPGFTLHQTASGHGKHSLVYKRDSDGMFFTIAWVDGIPVEKHAGLWSNFAQYIASVTPRFN